MNDNDIIKALEVCCDADEAVTCSYCPYKEYKGGMVCIDQMCKDTLDLINRQKAEIERLAAINKDLLKDLRVYHDVRIEDIKESKSIAIKEFAKRLKENMRWGDIVTCATHAIIDNLVKEMTEGKI